jgi:NADPH:quinone reductase-like Zn-dependent oxidoreductase
VTGEAVEGVVIETPGRPPAVQPLQRPEPGPGELLLRVTAAPIVGLDLLCASGTSYFGVPITPYVPGVQGVGVVEQGTPSVPPGTEVWFATSAGMAPGHGSMCELATAVEPDVVPLPAGADPALVAALGTSAIAAWLGLTWRGGLAAGEQVLVLGAGGVVGQAAIQLARTAGARRVVAAARSVGARDRARRAGPDALVELDDSDDVAGLAERIQAACDGPLDLVLDPLFGVPAAAALRVLRPYGRLVNLGSSAAEVAPIDSSTLRSRSLQILGYTNNALTAERRRDALLRVVEESVAGRLKVAYEPVPLHDAGDAWSRQATGRTDGRIVLLLRRDVA